MGWSNDEDLIVITDIGSIYMYDFDGTPLSQSSATSDIQDSRVIEAKVCSFLSNLEFKLCVLLISIIIFYLSES